MRRIRAIGIAAAALAAAAPVGGSAPDGAAGGGDEIGDDRAPEVARTPAPIPRLRPARPNARALPRGARASFPGFVGDQVFVALPTRRAGVLSGAAVYETTVRPLLRALRAPKETVVRIPRGTGRRLPGASLRGLAAIVCREFDTETLAQATGVHEMCAVMRGEKPPSPEIDAAFLRGEGMTFRQFKADAERRRIQYVFPQVVRNVPVESAGLVVSRWAGEAPTLVHGAVFTRFAIANRPRLTALRAASVALRELARLEGVLDVQAVERGRADLVLLPGGAGRDPRGRLAPAFRYAYRLLFFGFVRSPDSRVERVSWLGWADAATGSLLKLLPQYHFVLARGSQWRRAPDTPTQTSFFEVDPDVGGQYTLELNNGTVPVLNRIDRLGNGVFTDGEVAVPATSGGSGPGLANFDQPPVNDAPNAVCQSGGNDTYRQVNAFSHLYSGRQWIFFGGTITTFPEAGISVRVDSPGDTNFALYDSAGPGQSVLSFAIGGGFSDAACANAVGKKLNGAQESTTLVHELSHLSTARLQERRPANWCGIAPCPMPSGASVFHDFADAFAHAYASTPCMGGWSRRNQGGAGASANCVGTTSEGSGLPRLAQVPLAPTPGAPGDRFPDHRNLAVGDYADGQIAAAALWALRQGMRSKCLPSGTPQYFVRLLRALWNFGFTTTTCSGCDRDIYRALQDLLRQLVQQWATSGQPGGPPGFAHNGAHTTNKVTSSFARAGLFLVPYQCIDGNSATTDPACPSGENGGDAIIDVDDNDTSDDVTIDGVVHPERDFLRRAGPPPTFHIWTGPRFKFDAAGVARTFVPSSTTPSPCHVQYQVEVAGSPTFAGTVVTSTTVGSWNTVSTTSPPECHASWTMSAADWNTLKGSTGDTLIYYRVRTRDAAGTAATERLSTLPGNGLYSVPAPYAVIRDSGTP